MSNTLKLIGLAGKRGSGKGTVCDILQYQCGYHHPDVHIVNFADALKMVCAALESPADPHEVDYHYYDQAGKAEPSGLLGLTRGELLQQVGQALRDKHPSIWVDVTMKQVREVLAGLLPEQLIVVADIRYPNEAEAVKAAGGVLIRVEGDPLKQRGDGTRDDNHPSETALDNYQEFTAVIKNTGTLDDLTASVQRLLQELPEIVEQRGAGVYWPCPTK